MKRKDWFVAIGIPAAILVPAAAAVLFFGLGPPSLTARLRPPAVWKGSAEELALLHENGGLSTCIGSSPAVVTGRLYGKYRDTAGRLVLVFDTDRALIEAHPEPGEQAHYASLDEGGPCAGQGRVEDDKGTLVITDFHRPRGRLSVSVGPEKEAASAPPPNLDSLPLRPGLSSSMNATSRVVLPPGTAAPIRFTCHCDAWTRITLREADEGTYVFFLAPYREGDEGRSRPLASAEPDPEPGMPPAWVEGCGRSRTWNLAAGSYSLWMGNLAGSERTIRSVLVESRARHPKRKLYGHGK